MTPDYKDMTPEQLASQLVDDYFVEKFQTTYHDEKVAKMFQAQRAAGRAEGIKLAVDAIDKAYKDGKLSATAMIDFDQIIKTINMEALQDA